MNDVSCRHTSWLVDLCKEQGLAPHLFLKGIAYDEEYLSDPQRYVDWRSYAAFITNFRKLLSVDDIISASRNAWNHRTFNSYRLLRRLCYDAQDYYMQCFGGGGKIYPLIPCALITTPVAKGHISIVLTMNDDLQPCETFHYILLGQLMGLPEALGLPPARVKYVAHAQGAAFEVYYAFKPRLLSSVRKSLSFPFDFIKLFKELSAIQAESARQHKAIRKLNSELELTSTELEQKDRELQLIAESLNEAILIWNDQTQLQYVTKTLEKINGYAVDEILDRDWRSLFCESGIAELNAAIHRCLSGLPDNTNSASSITMETEIIHRSGKVIPVQLILEAGAPTHSHQIRVKGVLRDISQEKLLLSQWLSVEKAYQSVAASAPDGMMTLDANGYILHANQSAADIFGYPRRELKGTPFGALVTNPAEREATNGDLLKGGKSLSGLKRSGEKVVVDVFLCAYYRQQALFYAVTIQDFSSATQWAEEKQLLERRLEIAQKSESIGQLTSGIAHDFNNLLVAIIGYADLAMGSNHADKSTREYIRQIREAGGKAAEMTRKLLAFNRKQILEAKIIDLNELIVSLQPIIKRLLPAHIQLSFRPVTETAFIKADPGQIEQVLVNLVVNARDAMTKGGQLEIITTLTQSLKENGESSRAVTLTVADSGLGMSAAVVEQVFEPFYTTKPEGAGTGLGLSVVKGIVEQHDGHISLQSSPGKGTRVTISFPLTRKEPGAVRYKVDNGSIHASEAACLLVVEDDEPVRNLARLILIGAGYQVTSCADAASALKVVTTEPEKFDLLLVDVVMPEMSGRELMEKVVDLNPRIRFLFTSGYSTRGIHSRFITEMGLDFIAKPYTRKALTAKIAEIMLRKPGRVASVNLP